MERSSVAEAKAPLGAMQLAVDMNVSAVIFEGNCIEVFLGGSRFIIAKLYLGFSFYGLPLSMKFYLQRETMKQPSLEAQAYRGTKFESETRF
ncbi:hypothetical protein PanWU01x14_015260 [Parasponia andersonii]|uniref:Uncharacterized protein n=1 Tax=Parasponia andersonii TaxID=3476 RepID=A0A2P5E0F7_PARAD|nr:hypothetical protein PanWU01x14_015260 [Parasponia andersonii]